MDFRCFAWSAADKFFKHANWTPLSASSHHSWNYHPSLKIYRRFARLHGVSGCKRDIRVAIFILCKLEQFNTHVVAFSLPVNVGSANTKLFPFDKSALFPQHFFFFPDKCICCVWTFFLAFVPKVILLDFPNSLPRIINTL